MTVQSESQTLCVTVAVPLPVEKTFSYIMPQGLTPMVRIGCRVLVPFKNRKIEAYVLDIHTKTIPGQDLKEVIEVIDQEPLFPESMVPFFRWISDYYVFPMGQVIERCLPGGLKRTSVKTATVTEKGTEVFENNQIKGEEREILAWILANKNKPIPWPRSKLERLIRNEWIMLEESMSRPKTGPLMRKFVRIKNNTLSKSRLTEIVDTLRAKNEFEFLQRILEAGQIVATNLAKEFPNSAYLIKKWVHKGILEYFDAPVYRSPTGIILPIQEKILELSTHQKMAVQKISSLIERGGFSVCLLYGVTGSGKTEVYINAVQQTIANGKQAIIMVPEIALAMYMEAVIRARLKHRVAVYHSGMAPGQRYDQWVKMARGEIDLVIGARSAVFAPLPRLGLIVVDEEHDSSYKQDSSPRYQGRDCAVVRGKMEEALVILGSGTPSVQSFFNCQSGRYTLISMPERVEKRQFPSIELIDLRNQGTKDKTGLLLSPRLIESIGQTLEKGKQIILFLNRRGFYRFFLCQSCGKSVQCPNCEVSLIYHQDPGMLKCHYCGYHCSPVSKCPTCGNEGLKSYGFGTERLEGELGALFPEAKIARMDTDTIRQKGSIGKILKDFADKKIDILVGTQMITKGYDFPHVTLVGVVAADFSLGFPDFRAGERTFQLLSQVSGRAGRGKHRGRVLIQAFNPDHYAISAAVSNNYLDFYNKEISLRKQLGYPPFKHLISMRLQGNSIEDTAMAAIRMGEKLRNTISNWPERKQDIHVLGPVEAAIPKLKGKYRWQILLKVVSPAMVQELLKEAKKISNSLFKEKGVQLVIDVDPYQMV